MVEEHVHQWKPKGTDRGIIKNKKCLFVCSCGAFKIQKMEQITE